MAWGTGPFDPSPYSLNKLPLLNADTGEQIGIVVMNDNLTLLASNRDDGMGIMSYSVGTVTEEVYRSNESRMSIMPSRLGLTMRKSTMSTSRRRTEANEATG